MTIRREGLLIRADGSVERVPAEEVCGRYVFREEKCPTCGAHKKTRQFEVHAAVAEKDGQTTLVALEVPA